MKKLLALFIFLALSFGLCAQQKDSVRVFLKCRNVMSLAYIFKNYVPAASVISVKGGRLIENKDNVEIAVIPDSAVAVIEVRKGGKLTDRCLMYSVVPPLPIFELRVNGKSTSQMGATGANPAPSAMDVRPVADESFNMQVPRDAHYEILTWEITLMRNGQSLSHHVINGKVAPLSELNKIKSVAKSGDVLQCKVTKMKRKNAIGEMIDQAMGDFVVNYTLGSQ